MTTVTERSTWMSVLAQSQFGDLERLWLQQQIEADYQIIRQPEMGLAQVRARMGGTGRSFNMGDTTLTRAVVKLSSGEMGYSYLQGRNKAHAELAAVIDGLLQTQRFHESLTSTLIEPLAAIKQERDQQRAKEVASSKVDFFTMVRGED
ncbi:phosphonate C-P lyase system protein PhnG [Vibrio hippocampi]|uniref:Alpha-D-ribose 1-methylphosphonate 5-triphosphate synthase subunit PhnG n=1 Tax=Vibrio hippocampi TaxID=654686 RepID=A0ABM8ZPZ7_9VIBR|nr:phosphonate C-P lyase system protein PhnG [Vibrio hippocampi]CAH0530299.1 Alpha-D-ribose 1-methylphosphonate 5-triphosphate synthase subunit PhnG [Vibrio hippocampi]